MGTALIILGASLVFVSAIGVLRFGDALTRMHALTKASTLGVVGVVAGSALLLHDPDDRTSAILAALVQVLTLPVTGSLLGRAVYRADHGGDRHDDATAAAATAAASAAASAAGVDERITE